MLPRSVGVVVRDPAQLLVSHLQAFRALEVVDECQLGITAVRSSSQSGLPNHSGHTVAAQGVISSVANGRWAVGGTIDTAVACSSFSKPKPGGHISPRLQQRRRQQRSPGPGAYYV